MNTTALTHNGQTVAFIDSPTPCIYTAADGMDIIATAHYELSAAGCIIMKTALDETFFDLSTGLAGEIMQKFSNYRMKAAIVRDFSAYESNALKSFIYESNKIGHVLFLPTVDDALQALCEG